MSQTVAITRVKKAAADTKPSPDVMARLGPGCYVKVGEETGLFWAEITAVEGSKFTGVVQQIFAGAKQYGIVTGSEICFEKQLVSGTGCDKYCWC
ncbi:MAG: hypothetical protein GXP19_02950 [Gammaproteobacteria bacterium]|nr:hypothetical protein [Gammaproteobacteria bacterium]